MLLNSSIDIVLLHYKTVIKGEKIIKYFFPSPNQFSLESIFNMEHQIDKSISDIISRFKTFRGKKSDSKSDNLLFVDNYDFDSSNYTATLARHIETRSPCLIKGCFTPSEDRETTVKIAYEIEQSLLGSDEFLEPRVWIEEQNGRQTPLHYDNSDNQMFVFNGAKVFILFPPEQHRFLYHKLGFFGYMRNSKVDIENPDFERFPKLRKATPIIAIIQAGDMLYFPSDWSHQVYSLGGAEKAPGFALNYWFPVGAFCLWRSRSSQISMFLWSLFLNIFVKCRFKFLGRRTNMPKPGSKHYKLVYGDSDAHARYVSGLEYFLRKLDQRRKKLK